MAVKQMDTTASNIKGYLEAAMKDTKSSSFHAGEAMKLAFLRFVWDCLGTPEAERQACGKQAMATPGWFGSGNNSACRQAYENKKEDKMKEYKF